MNEIGRQQFSVSAGENGPFFDGFILSHLPLWPAGVIFSCSHSRETARSLTVGTGGQDCLGASLLSFEVTMLQKAKLL